MLLGSRAKRMHYSSPPSVTQHPNLLGSSKLPRVQKCHNRAFRYVDKLFGLQIEVYVADSNFNPGKGQDNTHHMRTFHAAQRCKPMSKPMHRKFRDARQPLWYRESIGRPARAMHRRVTSTVRHFRIGSVVVVGCVRQI